jgi:nicotinamidase-related amidase
VSRLGHLWKSTIKAEPAPVELDFARTALVIIDMQRDFLEPGGFGETLGNDVSQLARAVQPVANILAAARERIAAVVRASMRHAGMTVQRRFPKPSSNCYDRLAVAL